MAQVIFGRCGAGEKFDCLRKGALVFLWRKMGQHGNRSGARRNGEQGSRKSFLWLEWAILAVLALALLQTLLGYGGYLREGYRMAGVSVTFGLLAVLHAVWRLLSRSGRTVTWVALAPLPFLGYAGLSNVAITPAPWHGGLYFWALVEAWVVFAVVTAHLRHRKRQIAFLGVLLGVGAVAFVGAAIQVYINPEWLHGADRLRSPEFGRRAAGFLGHPEAFAGLMLLLFPIAFIGAYLRQMPGPGRILLGFLAFIFALGVIMSESRSAMIALAIGLMFMPTFLTPGLRRRTRLLWRFVLVAALLGPLLYFGSDLLARSMASAVSLGNPHNWALRGAAIAMFQDKVLVGQGIGAFETVWPGFQSLPMAGRPMHGGSEALQVLAEFGLLGALLLLVPLGWLLARMARVWRDTPFQAVSEEILFRESGADAVKQREHKRRRRRRHREGSFPAPRRKVLLGGLLAGTLLCLGHAMACSSLQMPIVLFMCAAVLAFMVAIGGDDLAKFHCAKAVPGVGGVVLPLLFLVCAYGFFAPARLAFLAQGDFREGDERLALLMADPDAIFTQPGRLSEAEAWFGSALSLQPEHGGALGRLGMAALCRYYRDFAEPEAAARTAIPLLRAAIALAPREYSNYFYYATALGFAGASFDSIKPVLDASVALAPRVPAVYVQYATFIDAYTGKRAEALRYVQSALDLDPSNSDALLLRDDLRMR